MTSQQLDEERIFHLARRQPDADAQAEYLDQVCAGDQALRERVEELLRVHEQEQTFLQSAAPSLPETVEYGLSSEKPGVTIGRYKLMEQIGEGGMGTVFVAQQERPIRRKVALKVIKPGMDSKAVVARFEAERQALAMMDHPNIARVLDAGATDSGRPYFVMEYVRGIPITEYCDRARLDTRVRLRLFAIVCQAIQHAHQKGVIHRDVKPSNVLVTEHDGEPVPKVIDFGVAKAINQQLTERTIYTRHQQIVGTPLYMSPEQAELSGLDIDTKTDIYSLGVLLYELLTGTTPFDKTRFDEAAYDEIRRIIREEEPSKPSTKISTMGERAVTIAASRKADIGKLQQQIRGELDWIVMKALEKDRNRRYETANGFAKDIQRFLNDEPVLACPPSTAYRVSKFVRRNRGLVAAAVSLMAVLCLGLIGTSVGLAMAKRSEVRAEKSEEEAWQSERKTIRALDEANRLADQNKALAMSEHDARKAAQASAEQLAVENYIWGVSLAYDALNRGNRNEFEDVMTRLSDNPHDVHRGIEWELLQARYNELLDVDVITTDSGVASLDYSVDGRYLAIACNSGTVMLLDRSRNTSIDPPKGMQGGHVMFSDDGHYVATSSALPSESSCRIWELPKLEQVLWQDPSASRLAFPRFSPDGMHFAGLNEDGNIEIRRIYDGEKVSTCLSEYTDVDVNYAFSPDGRRIVSGGKCETGWHMQLWGFLGELGELLDDIEQPSWKAEPSLTFAKDGSILIAKHEVWQISNDRLNKLDTLSLDSVCYSLDAVGTDLVAVGHADQTVAIWNLRESRAVHRLLHSSLVSAVAFSPGGIELAAGSRDNKVTIWRSRHWERDETRATQSFFPPLAIAPGGEIATSEASGGGEVLKVWTPGRNTSETVWTEPDAEFYGAAYSPKGDMLVAVSSNGTVRLRDEHHEVFERKAHSEMAACVTFTNDGEKFITGGSHGELFVWDIEKFEPRALPHAPKLTTVLASSPKGHVACGGGRHWSGDGHLVVWDISGDDPTEVARMDTPETVRSLAYSPDGDLLAITYKFSAGVVRVFDARTYEEKLTIPAHANKVTTLTFSPDGERLITGSDDGTIRFWELRDGRNVGTFLIGDWVRAIGIHPSGNALLTLSRDGWLRRWKSGIHRPHGPN